MKKQHTKMQALVGPAFQGEEELEAARRPITSNRQDASGGTGCGGGRKAGQENGECSWQRAAAIKQHSQEDSPREHDKKMGGDSAAIAGRVIQAQGIARAQAVRRKEACHSSDENSKGQCDWRHRPERGERERGLAAVSPVR